MSQYENQKRPLRYSKKKIDKAADDIRHGIKGAERIEAIEKIQNYREFHLYPLMLLKNHLARTAKKISPDVIVARRLKRLPTIIDKLERPTLDGSSANEIKFTRMQDIAGCRAIVRSPKQLWALKKRLERSRCVHKIIRTKDYLSEPKPSGYGGLHLIYKCYNGLDEEHPWKGSLVEVQLRTELQHAWATSLEIIDTLEGIALKTSLKNHEEWREFFYLAGKLVAHKEGFCVMEDNNLWAVSIKCQYLAVSLEVWHKLSKYEIAMRLTTDSDVVPTQELNKNGLFLIRITHESVKNQDFKVDVQAFSSEEASLALETLNESELSDEYLIAVLVSAEGVRSLKQAYPNYFGATGLFREFLNYVQTTSVEAEEPILKSAASIIERYLELNESGQITDELEKQYRGIMGYAEEYELIREGLERHLGVGLDSLP
ncbi:RelA/SpoT domain-containing protein [Vibrio fluvialis]|nr:RelA/SpoT domain-containing protein [Vibrio fluvialis]